MAATENPMYSTFIVNCVINALSSYTAIMLNILTIHAMRKTLSLPKPLKTLLLSLTVSDLAVGLVGQPFYIALMVATLKETSVSRFTANWYRFFTGIFSWTSFLGVVAVSVDRLLAIQLHLRYRAVVTHKRVVGVVISIWLCSTILSVTLAFSLIPINAEITRVVLAVTMGLCFICTAIIYCKIYFTVRRHRNQINVLQVPQQETRNGEGANAVRQRKSAVGTFFIYLVFLICYLPEYCRLLLIILPNDPSNIHMIRFYWFSWTLLFLNSALNPLVYCWKMRNIRRAAMNTIRSILSKPQVNNATLNSDIEGWSNSARLTVHSRPDTRF